MKVLWICFVWPEKTSSAAGFRTLELIYNLKKLDHQVTVLSPCQTNSFKESLTESGVETIQMAANDSKFDSYIKELNPDIVFFDRFIIEEQFSWRVKQICPKAIRVLDSVDLQSLRRTRQQNLIDKQIAKTLNPEDFHNQDVCRELASIYRSDFTIVTSDYEFDLLQRVFSVSNERLFIYRFSYNISEKIPDFESRKDFVCIGNFNHAPNLDSFKLLHESLWINIKLKLDSAGFKDSELHIYGAYPKNEIINFDNRQKGFRVKGWCEDALATLQNYRVNLAALRFGAGIKGKISDGWSVGTPAVGTSIAAEGMHQNIDFAGCISDDWDLFADLALELYTDKGKWEKQQQQGINIIRTLYNPELNLQSLKDFISYVQDTVEAQRVSNFIGEILWQQQFRSTEYFSRWIGLKNKHLS